MSSRPARTVAEVDVGSLNVLCGACGQALSAGNALPLRAWLETHSLIQNELIWLNRQGLSLILYYQLQQAGLLSLLPAALVDVWQRVYQEALLQAASTDWVVNQLLQALAKAGIDFTWIKGGALAHAVYPNPACRGRGDLDLWVLPEQVTPALDVLAQAGYSFVVNNERPDPLSRLVGGEWQMKDDASLVSLVEIQYPALRGEWARHTAAIDHEGIWARRVPVHLGESAYPTLSPEDSLIHLAFHQAINHQFTMPWLRNLLDLHLLVVKNAMDWGQITARAKSWRVATMLWATLTLARHFFGTAIPGDALQALQPPAWQQAAIRRLKLEDGLLAMHPGGYSHRRFWVQTALTDHVADATRLLWHGILPDDDWLRARYSAAGEARINSLRLRHLRRLLGSTEV